MRCKWAQLEGRYSVSRDGKIWNRVSKRAQTIHLGPRGYERVFIKTASGKFKWRTVHSLVAECFIGEKPSGCVINHKDGDKRNNNATNLEYVTPTENNRHARRIGLHKKQKLTAIDVERIKRASKLFTQDELAWIFDVRLHVIQDLLGGRSYKHIFHPVAEEDGLKKS